MKKNANVKTKDDVRRFIYVHADKSAGSKVWTIKSYSTSPRVHKVITTWGKNKVGNTMQSKVFTFSTEKLAQKFVERKLHEKARKLYIEIAA
jgi:predicted DNA-binding WGR domain protein